MATSNEMPWFEYCRRVTVATLIVLALIALVVVAWYGVYVLLVLFAGILLSLLLRWLTVAISERTGMGHRWSLALVLLGLAAAGAVAGWLIVPPLLRQVDELVQRLPQSYELARERISKYSIGQWVLEQSPPADAIQQVGTQAVRGATGVMSSVFSVVVGAVSVLFVAIYLAANPTLYTTGLLRLFPQRHRPRVTEVLGGLGYTLRWWLVGQLLTMLVVGILVTIGLWIVGVPMALALGVLAMLLDFIPNFGPVLAAVPGIVLALSDGTSTAVYVTAVYIVVQQIEGLILGPIIYQRTIELPPVLTISAQLLMGVMLGPLGLLLATPLMATVLGLVKMLYVDQTLGDPIDTPDDHVEPEQRPKLPDTPTDEEA